GDLAAELDLPRVPDGDLAQPGEVVVVGVDDQAGLFVVAYGVDAEVDGELGLDHEVTPRRRADQHPGVVAGTDEVGRLGGPAEDAVRHGGLRVGADPGPPGAQAVAVELVRCGAVQAADSRVGDPRGRPAGRLVRPGDGRRLRRVRGPGGGPAVDPVEPVDEHRPPVD